MTMPDPAFSGSTRAPPRISSWGTWNRPGRASNDCSSIYPRDGLANQAIAYDIGIVARSLLGDVLWLLGLPDAATEKADEAIELSRSSRRSPNRSRS